MFLACYEWEGRLPGYHSKFRSRQAAFSRTVHRLVYDKDLLSGLALAWCWVSKGYDPYPTQWQGGGRGAHKWGQSAIMGSPRFGVLSLTSEGIRETQRLKGQKASR